MSGELVLRNHQRAIRLDLESLRRTTRRLIEDELGIAEYELGIQFVSERRMADLNWKFLRHEGPTDVITFDYATPKSENHTGARSALSARRGRAKLADQAVRAPGLHGEVFICPAVAKIQAKQFRTVLSEELVRYIIHGALHLLGYDDGPAAARKVMKREEGKLLKRLEQRTLPKRARNAIS